MFHHDHQKNKNFQSVIINIYEINLSFKFNFFHLNLQFY